MYIVQVYARVNRENADTGVLLALVHSPEILFVANDISLVVG